MEAHRSEVDVAASKVNRKSISGIGTGSIAMRFPPMPFYNARLPSCFAHARKSLNGASGMINKTGPGLRDSATRILLARGGEVRAT